MCIMYLYGIIEYELISIGKNSLIILVFLFEDLR